MKTVVEMIFVVLVILLMAISCKTTEGHVRKLDPAIEAKTGAQLWAENCIRCHYAPSPATFSDHEWEVVGMHMQIRGNLTPVEREKIVEFLKSSN